MIADLITFKTQFDSPIQDYDDGIGLLWVYRNSMGVVGIVRAQSWEDALEIVYDEFLKPIEPGEEVLEAFGLWVRQNGDTWQVWDDQTDNREDGFKSKRAALDRAETILHSGDPDRDLGDPDRDLGEGYQYQANVTGTGIVSIDLNGESLDQLTDTLVEQLGIKICIGDSDND